MTLAILFSLKTMESLENGLQPQSGVTPLFSNRTESLASSQSCQSIDTDAWCKRAFNVQGYFIVLGVNVRVWFQIADILSSCGGRMSASEHSDYGYFEKRLQKIFSDETGEYISLVSSYSKTSILQPLYGATTTVIWPENSISFSLKTNLRLIWMGWTSKTFHVLRFNVQNV